MAKVIATFPKVDDLVKTEAFPSATWELEPHRSGFLPVAAGRGGPINISWETHGEGPIKLVFISGMAVFKTSYQRQTMHFGHNHGDKYTVLILDNRGMGRSDKPLMRYSTSAMAADLIEVLDHLSWKGERELHLCGLSMGGMIAQEIACVIPERIASLSLCCTAAKIENTTGFAENVMNRVTMLLPKSLDRSITYSAEALFPASWLPLPDDCEVPQPGVTPRAKGGPYGKFESNFARYAAQEITKQRDRQGFTKTGFLLQLLAAGWHHKSRAQLQGIGDKVGRERIMVMHGTYDGVISVPHGRKLIEYLDPGRGIIVEGMGHAPVMERTKWFNDLVAEVVATGEKLSGR
ncbi:Alpha/Beta hydrolase protein [Xylariaceae sp. FL0255]|nr:Alpha/Beta hydrolase protein [Xylariaceae sp. FL0255]